VSLTKQARNLPAEEAREPDADDGALDEDGFAAGDEDGLALVADPHAVANRAMTPSATAFLIIVRTVNLLTSCRGRPAGGLRAIRDAPRARRARARVYEPQFPDHRPSKRPKTEGPCLTGPASGWDGCSPRPRRFRLAHKSIQRERAEEAAGRAPGDVYRQPPYGLDSATSGLDCGFMLPPAATPGLPFGQSQGHPGRPPAGGTLPGRNLAVLRAA
jgi:hypothetical protein